VLTVGAFPSELVASLQAGQAAAE